jgi:hypothetical protein
VSGSATTFADLKRELRRAAHDAFAVPATYGDDTLEEPVDLLVRWHQRVQTIVGDHQYAAAVETAERVTFDRDELAEKGVTPRRGGLLTMAGYERAGTPTPAVYLDNREPWDGTIAETWNVSRDLP